MLSEIAIIEIDKILELCDTYLLNQHEIDLANATGADPQTTCEYYDVAQQVVTKRSEFDTTQNNALDTMQALAAIDGCVIELAPEVVPEVFVPILGGFVE